MKARISPLVLSIAIFPVDRMPSRKQALNAFLISVRESVYGNEKRQVFKGNDSYCLLSTLHCDRCSNMLLNLNLTTALNSGHYTILELRKLSIGLVNKLLRG